jgi:hypothetical protein
MRSRKVVTIVFIWGHTSNCWNSFAIYILAVFDPYFFKLCEKSGVILYDERESVIVSSIFANLQLTAAEVLQG